MPPLAQQLGSIARFAAHRAQREREDNSALAELSTRSLNLPPGLELEWLGVAGYRLTYEGQSIFIDPYVSRVPLLSTLRRAPARVSVSAHERYLRPAGEVLGVLVGHTHFDHAIDVPALVAHYGCDAYGSSSLSHLMRLHGLGERAVEVAAHRPYELGPFVITFVPSLHSKLILGFAVPYDGELTCDHLDHLSPAAYRCGQVYGLHIEVAGTTFYHQGSANLIDAEVTHREVDYFLAGVAGRSFTTDYWSRILTALAPRVVVPSHFDDFFVPLSKPMGFSLNVNLAAVPDEIAAVSGDFTVATPPLLEPVVGA